MASTAQIHKLRRKLEDFYNKRTGDQLTTAEQAFKDDEINDIIDDAIAEATDGEADYTSVSQYQLSLALILGRADGVLQVAQDEARRIRWQTNNEINDPSMVAANLVRVAEALQKRYAQARDRDLKKLIEGVDNRPTGAAMKFNGTVKANSERNFNNRTVNRNRSPDHGI